MKNNPDKEISELIKTLRGNLSGQRADVVVSALQTILAQITLAASHGDRLEAHKGVDAFGRDVKNFIDVLVAKKVNFGVEFSRMN